jgi:hypothetical protein
VQSTPSVHTTGNITSMYKRSVLYVHAQPLTPRKRDSCEDIRDENTSVNSSTDKANMECRAILKIYQVFIYVDIYYQLIWKKFYK